MAADEVSSSSVSRPGLPWIRKSGEPEGVGISLSGGGIRAAAFGMGALQVLEGQKGLLAGATAADHLSVVSGGSYIGATATLNAHARTSRGEGADGPPVLARESPEVRSVVSNGRYLIARGAGSLVGFLLVPLSWNLLSLAGIIVQSALILSFANWYTDGTSETARGFVFSDQGFWEPALATAILLSGTTLLLRRQYSGRPLVPAILGPAIVILLAATANGAFAALDEINRFTAGLGLWWWALAVVVAVALIALSARQPQTPAPGKVKATARDIVRFLADLVPRVTVVVVLAAVCNLGGIEFFFKAGPDRAIAAVAISTLLAFVLSDISNRVSLNRGYRDRLAECFAVVRDGDEVRPSPPNEKFSYFTPGVGAKKFPRLLVCATANVNVKAPTGVRRGFSPFVFSHDRCGFPDDQFKSISTVALENAMEASQILRHEREPIVSLMGSIATTGAAISPALGRRTVPALRPLLAALNMRLGKWLPNPLNENVRKSIEARNLPWDYPEKVVLGKGWDQLVPELFGIHSESADRVYVTDGGHYENLGLTALLHARCAEIWCVDSEVDKELKFGVLEGARTVASTDLDIEIEYDREKLKENLYVEGTIRYPGTEKLGVIRIIKLGWPSPPTSQEPSDTADLELIVKEHERSGRFPFHSTARFQWFDKARMDAYRALGALTTRRCLRAADEES